MGETIPVPMVDARFDEDASIVLHDVSWSLYVALRKANDTPALRFTYLDGELEIMSPSGLHELRKTMLARLIEAYVEERDLPFDGYGSTTYRKKPRKAGLEPDECYVVGDKVKKVPDLALEVALSPRGINKLEVYRRLGVPEVWYWVNDSIRVFRLGPSGYARRARSKLLPDLDLEELAAVVLSVRPGQQTRIVRAYRARLRKRS